MLVKKTKVLPIECVVRGLSGGFRLEGIPDKRDGLRQKAARGTETMRQTARADIYARDQGELGKHDENISFEQCVEIIGEKNARIPARQEHRDFQKGGRIRGVRGIILADTKFEWGEIDGKIILIDEVLTPDSSRFWPADKYEPGRDQESFDKQFVRNYLEDINFDKSGPGVELPEDVVKKTSEKYIEAYERLTGSSTG